MLSFQLRKRLREFSVEIEERIGAETLVLIGHSGCGKSTTLKMLAGLVAPDEGSIESDGRFLWKREEQVDVLPEDRNIGFVFQNYALFPHLTVEENVAYGISRLSREERETRVREVLDFLGLTTLAQAKPSMLSGGEQQRVALARALVTRPKMLLLDEPLSALDISTRSYVRAELKEILRQLAIPTIVVTHDYEDARVLADRVAVMDRGRIIQSGTPKEIAQYPANHFVAEFTGTNLLPVPSAEDDQGEEHGRKYVSFDPWKVQVASAPVDGPYQWSGTIRDIAWTGGFVRVNIEADFRLLADIPMEQMESGGFQVGDQVHASVQPEDARPITTTSAITRPRDRKDTRALPTQAKSPMKKWGWAAAVLSVLTVSALATGYGISSQTASGVEQENMVAFVAANATDPFNDVIGTFEAKHPEVNLEATYAGTQILRTQLEHGAEADLFISADLLHIEAVKQQGLIGEYYPVSSNHEVIVVPKNNAAGIHSLQDLGTKPHKLVIGTETVPIGRYTRQVFQKANADYGPQFSEKVMSRVVSLETNVKQVLQKVALGEADAGIVYFTDVNESFKKKVTIIEIPDKYNVEAINYVSVPKDAPNPELADELLKLLRSPEGQASFAKFGYDPVK